VNSKKTTFKTSRLRPSLWSLLIAAALIHSTSKADFDFTPRDKNEFSLSAGTLLPWGGIPGVKETYAMWGASFFHPSSIWDLEYQFLTARGKGVIYNSVSAGFRFDFTIEKTLEVFLLGGIDFHHYQRASRINELGDEINYDFNQTFGIHLGFGGFFAISEIVKLRSELKFHQGPGKSIYVGLGPTVLF
jgi:hypothetical protein